ncbi:hypothetical protein HGRIS_004296 [Hohenbuehelia grisea]|uniref:Uncharacterized protein n=1 Tax=Hohenbuehelia grisea TaxID=104357 RepID=A0ABR3IPC0_9AGAR
MAKLNGGDRLGSSRTPQRTPRQTPATSQPMSPRSRPMHAEDVFSGPSQPKTSFQISTISTPSVSPRPLGTPPLRPPQGDTPAFQLEGFQGLPPRPGYLETVKDQLENRLKAAEFEVHRLSVNEVLS